MIEALRSFGITVVEESTEMTNKSLSNQDRVNLLRSRLEQSDGSLDEPFLFVFSFNFFPVISDVCEIYQIPYVCWSVDSPLAEIYTKQVRNRCNRLFLFDRQQYDSLKQQNSDGIFHLPLCTNTDRWDQVIAGISEADRNRFSSDISFIGSLYTEKDPWSSLTESSSSESSFNSNREQISSSDRKAAGSVSLSPRTIGYAEGLVAAQLSLIGCNILKEALEPDISREIASACADKYPSSIDCVMDMDPYIASQHILGMHASSLQRIRLLDMLAKQFPVDLYTRSPIPEALQASTGQNMLRVHDGVKTLTEMPKIFHLGKINLNMTIYPIQSGLSLRIWDVLGCGGFLMTNLQPELTEHFTPGTDLDVFSSAEELVDKCAFYLSHEEIRQRIALNGYRKVKESHTYQKRFAEMLRQIT